ncbi:InlB B-repeat-containing protein [Candidatus Saccharibacteria bacterium]|nr:InlB B-repeat-containing protein [Candidatus Saccharibacteria bacterium]
MQNKRKTKLILAGISLAIASFLVSDTKMESVSAYSASITTSNAISLDAIPTGDGTSIHSESINVQSDCRVGYNLTIATPEGSDLYKYDNGTQSSNTASFTAVDGTSALNSNNNTNKWGYTLTTNPTGATIFSPLSATESILKTSSQTASPTSDINDTFNINYGVKTDITMDPGTYSMANNGTIIYYLTMDTSCAQYTVAFNANGGTGSVNGQTMELGAETKLTSADSLTAPTGGSYTDAGNNTITGDPDKLWTFWGWNTAIDGTGDWYKDREKVQDLVSAGSTITLYAQWKQATLADMVAAPTPGPSDPKVINHNEMQDMSAAVCYNSPITAAADAPAATLLDYRGKVTTGSSPEQPEQYTVSKLADGLCWMTTNLNLGRTGTDGPNGDGTVTLTSDDTDLADNTTFTLPASTTTSNTTTTAATIRTTNDSGTNANGTYYSWAAAVANTNSISTSPSTSICPRNWDLPASSQYTNLSTKSSYTSTNPTTATPSSFLIDGGFTNGSDFYQTSYSHFWTNVSSSTSAAYGARVNSTAMTTSASTGSTYGGNKYYRKNIRCVATQGKVTVNYNGNGNNGGTMAPQTNVEINSTNLTSNAFTRTHYGFKNWNTEANGSGTTIANSATLSTLNLKPGDTITLYAQWTPQRQIIYNDNCSYNNAGCASNTDTTNTSNWTNAGSSITLGSDTYFATRPGYAITSWNTARDGTGTSYNVSSSYTVPSTLSSPDQVTLYAQWSSALTINFNSNGGSGTMTSQLIPENTSKALKSNSFTAPSGNYFIGWMTEESRATNTVVYANGATYTTSATVTPGDSITLYAKWGPRYTIIYNGNNATGGSMISSGTELKHTSINEGANVKLYAPNYYKINYGFVGWSPVSNTTVGGSAPIYGPNESIIAPDYSLYGQEISGTKTITLYAIWLEADSNETMQTFSYGDCQAMPQATYNSTTGKITAPAGSVIALRDQRDGNVYTIARLADGNCWMTENLRLEAENTVGNNQYDSSVTNQSLSQGYGGVFTGLDASENANFSLTTTATPNNIYNSTNITGSSYTGDRFPRYNNNNTKTSLTASYNGTVSSGTYYSWYSYGNYYTWAAAMANTTYYSSATGTSGSESAGTSICPTNWTLPTGGSTAKGFGILSQSYGGTGGNQTSTGFGGIMSNRFRSFPNNFLYSGIFDGSSPSNRGTYGYYWSRSASDGRNSYSLYLYSTTLSPIANDPKNDGFSVRCLVGS